MARTLLDCLISSIYRKIMLFKVFGVYAKRSSTQQPFAATLNDEPNCCVHTCLNLNAARAYHHPAPKHVRRV